MGNEISFKDAMAIIDRVDSAGEAICFDITFRSLQRNSKTGGKLYEYKGVKKYISKKVDLSKKSLLKVASTTASVKRNPNHFSNRTRNLELQNGDIKKVHVRLIITINGKKVIY